jgi:hypothetical protein
MAPRLPITGGLGLYVSVFSEAQVSKGLARPSGRLPHEFFEKEVDSFSKLLKELELLDVDSGIRTFGDYSGRKGQFVFVTRSPHDTYTLMVYEKTGDRKAPSPGKRMLVKEFAQRSDLARFMKDILSKPVRAFVY